MARGSGEITRDNLYTELKSIVGDGKYELSEGDAPWPIKVGTIYTNVEQTESQTIKFGRYIGAGFSTVPYEPVQTEVISYDPGMGDVYNYTEQETSVYGNAVANDLDGFIQGTTINGGYYLGRYEAGVSNYDTSNIITENSNDETNWTGYKTTDGKEPQLVCKAEEQVWNYITQNKASEVSINMYEGSETFTSDLANSYAWDTAIIFIQLFSECEDYRSKNLSTNMDRITGITGDEYCNIYDMSGNVSEWTTEDCDWDNGGSQPCVERGGNIYTYDGNTYTSYSTSARQCVWTYWVNDSIGFRPILYLSY